MNTEKATGWACCVFEEWRDKRNKTAREKCPLTPLEEPDAHALSCWLSRFVVEVRRADGRPYSPTSISNILGPLSILQEAPA